MLQCDDIPDRDKLADIALADWRRLYDDVQAFVGALPKAQRKKALAELRAAHRCLQRLAPFMRDDNYFPRVLLKTRGGSWGGNVVDFLAGGSLLSVADWLDSFLVRPGQKHGAAVIAQAAIELSGISRRAVGKPDWPWVKKRLKRAFGEDSVSRVKSLRDLCQKFKALKTSRFRQRRLKEAFKLFPNLPMVVDSPAISAKQAVKNIDAIFQLSDIRGGLTKSFVDQLKKLKRPKKRAAPKKAHRFQAYKPKNIPRR